MDAVEEGLLLAIRDAPDDDEPRLIYADWLATREPVRGELIAIACELARTPSRKDLAARREELLASPELSWWRSTVRGFLPGPRQTIDAKSFVADPDWIFRVAPTTTWLAIGDPHACLRELVEVPALARYAELELYTTYGADGPRLHREDFRVFATSPHLASLRGLAVAMWADAALVPILGSGLALRALRLRGLGDEVRALCSPSPSMSHLEELELEACSADRGRLLPVLREAWRATLRTFAVHACEIAAYGDEAVAAITSRTHLEVLDLEMNELDDEALAPLAGARRNLRELRLGSNELGPAGIEAIVDAGFERLTTLSLRGCALEPEDIRHLFANAPRSLVSLELASNHVGDALDALSRSADPHRFEVLLLERSGLDLASLARFVQSPAAERLQVLDVQGNYFPGDTLTKAVKRSRYLGALRQLRA